jgi:ribosomal protein S18 acetylase RimI-like enzyme
MGINHTAAGILADAFLHYPLMRFAFREREKERSMKLHKLFNKSVVAASLYGGVLVSADAQAALTWLPGKHFPLTLWSEFRAGMLAIPLQIGIKPTLRLMNHDTVPESWIGKQAGEKMGYIWCVGVQATQRGKGHSRNLIDQSIADMRAHGMKEFWLKTDDAQNVPIYQKLGFEVMMHTTVKSSQLPTWVFRRKG